jgi:hypothetical protein
MRKSMLTMGSILYLFILVSISYQPIIADEIFDEIIDYNLNKTDISRVFYVGGIYNSSYSEIYINDTLWKIHSFNCSKVLLIAIWKIFPFFMILKDGFPMSIVESSNESFDIYYKGYIGNNFICTLQVIKIYQYLN